MPAPCPNPLSVVIADPNDLTRAGLCSVLGNDGRFAIVGQSAAHVISVATRLQPDLVVIDPERRGSLDLALISRLSAVAPASRIVVFSRLDGPGLALEAIRAGARGYLLKSNPDAEFLQAALADIGRFGAVVADPVLYDRFRMGSGGDIVYLPPGASGVHLTQREREVLVLLAGGATDQEAAGCLRITANTIESHVRNAFARFGARTRIHGGFLLGSQRLISPQHPDSLPRSHDLMSHRS